VSGDSCGGRADAPRLFPDGHTEVYTKHHLHGSENRFFQPATENPMVGLHGEKIAFAICADTTHAVHAQNAAARGASIYLAGVYFSPESFESNAARMRGYAEEHAMLAVLANSASPGTGTRSAGRSAIWSPSGELLDQLEGIGSGIVLATRGRNGWHGEAFRV